MTAGHKTRSGIVDASKVRIALFFSLGISLKLWKQKGLMDREVGYYKALRRHVSDVALVTYDKPGDDWTDLVRQVEPLRPLPNPTRTPYRLYGLIAPLVHRGQLKQAHVLKTNQISGAWSAVLAKWLLQKPLIVRCGFVASLFARHGGVSRGRLFVTTLLERFAVRNADMVFVASQADAQYISDTHGVPTSKIKFVPNPIDTDLFRPLSDVAMSKGTVAFVGRLSEQKNLPILLQAIDGVRDCKLVLYGAGPLESMLRQMATARVEFRGTVPNYELTERLAEAEVFVLPSHYEGTPKALLEAMACGKAVVGTNVPGIRDVLEHGVTGLLVEPGNSEALREAIQRVLDDPELRDRLGRNAREFILSRYSQAGVVQREVSLLTELGAKVWGTQ